MRRRGSLIFIWLRKLYLVRVDGVPTADCQTMNLVGLFIYASAPAGVTLYFKFKFAPPPPYLYLLGSASVFALYNNKIFHSCLCLPTGHEANAGGTKDSGLQLQL